VAVAWSLQTGPEQLWSGDLSWKNTSTITRNTPVKKIELHLDALITIIVVFVLAFSFVLYQRYQYSDLLQENIDLSWDNEKLKVNLIVETSLLDECKNEKESEIEIKAD
jgi:hypothetical protein